MVPNKKGSALIEAAIVLLLLSAGMAFLCRGVQVVLTAQRAQSVARFAAFLEAESLLPSSRVSELSDEYAASLFRGRRQTVSLRLRRFDRTPASRFYDLVEAEAEIPAEDIVRGIVLHRSPR